MLKQFLNLFSKDKKEEKIQVKEFNKDVYFDNDLLVEVDLKNDEIKQLKKLIEVQSESIQLLKEKIANQEMEAKLNDNSKNCEFDL